MPYCSRRRAGRTSVTLMIAILLALFAVPVVHASSAGLYKDGVRVLDLQPADSTTESPAAKDLPPHLKAAETLMRRMLGDNKAQSNPSVTKYTGLIEESFDIIADLVLHPGTSTVTDAKQNRLVALVDEIGFAYPAYIGYLTTVAFQLENTDVDRLRQTDWSEFNTQHQILANEYHDLLSQFKAAHLAGDATAAELELDHLMSFVNSLDRPERAALPTTSRPVPLEQLPAPVLAYGSIARASDHKVEPIPSHSSADPADLEETLEIQFTPEIVALAEQLDHSPARIYEYVHNNLAFEPYLGSRKGAAQTLAHRGGNDYDLASLTIALLRVSGIPSRYLVLDTVEMTIDQATSWLRCPDAWQAGAILTTARMEGIVWTMGGDPYRISCKRVVVMAEVPYTNYRGALNDSTGMRWLTFDPAFAQHQIDSSVYLMGETGLDGQQVVEDYYATLRSETPTEFFTEMLLDSLALYHPGADSTELYPAMTLRQHNDGLLPATLPYDVVASGADFAEIPTDMRFRIRFHLHSFEGSSTAIDHTLILPEIAGKSITISFEGATPADQTVIDTSGSIFGVDIPSAVYVQPVLRVDGCEVARGSGSVQMGRGGQSDMHFTPPTGGSNQVPAVYNHITAGNYQAVGVDPESVMPSLSFDPITSCDEDAMGWELYQTALTYLNNVDVADDQVADLMHIVLMNDVSEAIVENSVVVTRDPYTGVPLSFEWTGLIVDADRKIVGPFSMYGDDIGCDFMRIAGADGSWQENRLFESKYEQEAISTMKILALASDSGIPICTITGSIAADCPGFDHPSSVYSAVNAALSAGHHVIIPQRSFTYYEWTGTAWIDMQPASCAAGYIISGGHQSANWNGGATVWVWDDPFHLWFIGLCEKAHGPVTVIPSSPNDMYCADSWWFWTFVVPQMDYYGGLFGDPCSHLYSLPRVFILPLPIAVIAAIWGPGEYEFRAGADHPDCAACGEITKTVTIVKVELTNETNDYVAVGQTLPVHAKVTPGLGGGMAWQWSSKAKSNGSGSYTASNPTTLTGNGEGCVYPVAAVTGSGVTCKSDEDKRILIYTDPGPNAVVVPTSNPTVTNPGPDNTCTPAFPTLDWSAHFDIASKEWQVRVNDVDCGGAVNINPWSAAGTPNPVPGGNVTQANYLAIIADLSDYDTPGGGAGPVWHSTAASTAHENHHWFTDWMQSSVGQFWTVCETDLEKLKVAEGTICKAADARTALLTNVNTRFNQFVAKVVNEWNTVIAPADVPGGGGGGYAAGVAVLNGIINNIYTLARNPDGVAGTHDAWGTPTGAAAGIAGAQVDVSWVDPCVVESGFTVQRKVDTGAWTTVASPGANNTSWSDASVSSGHTYSYRVKATTSTDDTGWSNTATVAVP